MTTTTHWSWRCYGPATVPPTACDERGEGVGSDAAAEAHTAAANHMTITSGTTATPKESEHG